MQNYLNRDIVTRLVTRTVLQRLDYCNSLLVGLSISYVSVLERVQNAAVRRDKCASCTAGHSVLHKLHRLLVQ